MRRVEQAYDPSSGLNQDGNLVLRVDYGGLGDSLFLSPIPRLYKAFRPNGKVYISKRSHFRNEETRRLVWDLNPYVDGLSESDGIAPQLCADRPQLNIIARTARGFGIDINEDIEPEIYYSPKCIVACSGSVLVDLNYTSFVGAFSKRRVLAYIEQWDNVIMVNPPPWAVRNRRSIVTKNLAEYADVIHSGRLFVCLTSGGATLAAALGRRAVCLYGAGQDPIFHHSKMHQYVDMSHESRVAKVMLATLLKAKNAVRARFASRR